MVNTSMLYGCIYYYSWRGLRWSEIKYQWQSWSLNKARGSFTIIIMFLKMHIEKEIKIILWEARPLILLECSFPSQKWLLHIPNILSLLNMSEMPFPGNADLHTFVLACIWTHLVDSHHLCPAYDAMEGEDKVWY